ncbi:DNA circularization N-terminal domain-containing protein [Roseomonas elaeocarpi]|uniref:DNA circularization N-terminal domain-containing protein n=1 Tax=Roseomonas elaeocarpi TaxID=907779 RepID=A0ABV6JQC9_9PROT
MSWLAELLPASWRGITFYVRNSNYLRGRRTVVHQYAFRDAVWVEDMGRAARITAFTGFVVGDDCYAKARALILVSEQKGPGTLIHPSLGVARVSLIAPLQMAERADLGRVVELQFQFAETTDPTFPSIAAATQDIVGGSADDAASSFTSDFNSSIGSALDAGASAASSALDTVSGWVGQVASAAQDASLVSSAVAGLSAATGTFGRYSSGRRGSVLSGVSTAAGALSAVTVARTVVGSTSSAALAAAAGL